MTRFCFLPVLVAAVVATACGGASSSARNAALPDHRMPSGPIAVGADTVTLLPGGEPSFQLIRNTIAQATRSVEVEMYELGRRDLLAALIEAHRRGVSVTVIGDPTVDVTAASAATLRTADINVIDYPVRKMMIDHVKLLLVDHRVGIVGGINWGEHSAANHDFDALVRGPVVTNLEHVYASDVVTAGQTVEIPATVSDPNILVASTLPQPAIHPLALDVIENARHRLQLELYVITEPQVVHALARATGRGVNVTVLLDPDQRSSDPSAAALRNAGVHVLLYASHGEKLHAKAMVADDDRILFGSANWSKGGFERNHELDVEIVHSPALAAAFEQQMAADWSASGG